MLRTHGCDDGFRESSLHTSCSPFLPGSSSSHRPQDERASGKKTSKTTPCTVAAASGINDLSVRRCRSWQNRGIMSPSENPSSAPLVGAACLGISRGRHGVLAVICLWRLELAGTGSLQGLRR